MRRLQQHMLDAHGETLVTMFVIERHPHEAADVFSDRVGPNSVILPYRLMETLSGRPRSAQRSECEPADFYAGLCHCPLASKSWFSSAGCWCK